MTKIIDYFFTAPSPWSFLGHERFVAMARRHGATVNVKPMDSVRVFAVSGGLPLAKRAPQRQAYRLAELKRWRDFLGVRLNVQPKYFPVSAEQGSLAIVAADASNRSDAALEVARAVMRACWVEEQDIADPATIARIGAACGGAPLSDASRAAAKARYDAYTQEAIERQVFGAPSYVYRNEIFWGQDRLDFLERALAAR